jgi:hypothetical protein
MKNRRILREDLNNPGANQFTDPTLKKAFAAGCWPATVTGPMKDKMAGGAEAVYQFSQKPENAANPHVFDKPDGTREWRTTADEKAKVARTSKWYCEKLKETQDAVLTPDQQKALDRLGEFTSNQVVAWKEGVDMPVSQGWKLVNLSDAIKTIESKNPNYASELSQVLGTNIGIAKVWVKSGSQQYDLDLSTKTVARFAKLGYIEKKDLPEGTSFGYTVVNLQDCNDNPETCKQFQTPYYMYFNPNILADNDVITKLEEAINSAKSGDEKTRKVSCKNAIELYGKAYDKKLELSPERLRMFKPVIRNCSTNYPNLSKSAERLQFTSPVQTQSGGVTDYSLNVNAGKTVQREHKEQLLKSLIRESLLEVKETKKKRILAENKIVSTRLTFISENVTLKTKKQKEKYFNELLSEMVYLNSQGFDKGVINEGLWDMVKGLFGNGADSVMQYFKEYIAKWLIGNLTPMDPNGWIGGTIVKAIGNLPIGDIPKLTDCNFLTALLSKSIAEEALDQVKNKAGMEGPFYDILRNAIVESLEDTSFGSKIEHGLGSVICPMLGGVTSKMGSMADKLKQNALTTS